MISWLERMGVVQTFEADPLELEQNIVTIREVLDEPVEENKENPEC